MDIKIAQDTVIIVAEFPSAHALHARSNSFIYGDDSYEFTFQRYSPAIIAKYPERYFLYVQYSQAEFKELYLRVDMTLRIEPVDYLIYSFDSHPYRTFFASDNEMLARLGEFELVPFEKIKKGNCDEKEYEYVIEDIFGKASHRIMKKNNIVIFHNENSMLGFLDLLVNTLNFPKEQVRVGRVPDRISGRFDSWALAVMGVTNEVERLRDTVLGTYEDIIVIEHSAEIAPEHHGFYVEGNQLAVGIMTRVN